MPDLDSRTISPGWPESSIPAIFSPLPMSWPPILAPPLFIANAAVERASSNAEAIINILLFIYLSFVEIASCVNARLCPSKVVSF